MAVFLKVITNRQLYLYMNGRLIYKRWLDTGQSLVFDIRPYDKNTLKSITDITNKQKPE
jgi:hypothetical protein